MNVHSCTSSLLLLRNCWVRSFDGYHASTLVNLHHSEFDDVLVRQELVAALPFVGSPVKSASCFFHVVRRYNRIEEIKHQQTHMRWIAFLHDTPQLCRILDTPSGEPEHSRTNHKQGRTHRPTLPPRVGQKSRASNSTEKCIWGCSFKMVPIG